MTAINATDARRNLFGLIQQVNEDHSPVEVVSKHGNAVIISKVDYDAGLGGLHLLAEPGQEDSEANQRSDSGCLARSGHRHRQT